MKLGGFMMLIEESLGIQFFYIRIKNKTKQGGDDTGQKRVYTWQWMSPNASLEKLRRRNREIQNFISHDSENQNGQGMKKMMQVEGVYLDRRGNGRAPIAHHPIPIRCYNQLDL